MSDILDRAWYEARVEAVKALIVAYESALLAIASGAQSYSLNTGQTTQSVTKANVASVRDTLNELHNQLSMLERKLCGKAIYVTPGF